MTTIVSFVDLAPGDIVTNQFSDDFGVAFTEPAGVIEPDSKSPFGNALEAARMGGPVEFPYYGVQGTFSTPSHFHIGISVNQNFTIYAKDDTGAVIGNTIVQSQTFSTDGSYFYGEFATGAGNIQGFDITAEGRFNIASVTFDNAEVHHAPDFRFMPDFSDIPGINSESGFIEVIVARLYGSTGPISLSVSSSSAGYWTSPGGTFSGNDGDKAKVSLTAVSDSIKRDDLVTVTGTPDSGNAGASAHGLTYRYDPGLVLPS